MSVKLRKRKNADGSISLRLDIYRNGQRTVETLKHLKLSRPSTEIARQENKKLLDLAARIATARAAELEANNYSVVTDAGKKTVITEWMKKYVDAYTKKDKRNMQGALNRFITFLNEEKKAGLTFSELTALLTEEFIEFLEANSIGEGASSYYKRFKKMIRHAYRKNLVKDVMKDVTRKVKGQAKKKDILTLAELKKLSATHTESSEVKNAFLFTCVTGLRWIDIKALAWENIDLESRQMTIYQSKTERPVTVPLNDTALKLLKGPGKPADKIFSLPSPAGANKTLKAWVNRAGIKKKISWHNGRHSFGTNLVFNGVDVVTASKLLGHSDLEHTKRYVDAAREMKETATSKINIDL